MHCLRVLLTLENKRSTYIQMVDIQMQNHKATII